MKLSFCVLQNVEEHLEPGIKNNITAKAIKRNLHFSLLIADVSVINFNLQQAIKLGILCADVLNHACEGDT